MSVGLGEQIRQTRKAMGLSQAAFAPLVGMKANFLSDLEVGKRAIGPKTLDKLIRFAS
jgi:transcriptional regulator with XRE-family HTH domain